MKIGDLLLLKGFINKKQLTSALSKQADEAINYNRSVPLGKILIEEKYVTVEEVAEALNDQQQEIKIKKKDRVMPTEIGEDSKFTFDLKFMVTIGAVIVSASATYFSITGQIEELKSNNSPNRLEHDYVVKEIDNIKSMGDLKIISYKLDEYDETFKELKTLSTTLSPLAADLTYIKEELEKLRNKKVNIPEVDLSGIDDCKDKLDALADKLNAFEERVSKLEKRNSKGGRF
ncbi:hypothetical protein [Acinetobacter sp.]|uniref:hypothetical protein n=1 Tax=Acinetobacter sp. TaxID=472 RepID=UPI000C09C9B5|nr:hypothetical protein [Acinetobacter sp.]MAK32345.1 hypothetical protein [Acinetobacter sp.]QDP47177.1 MAG: hypothetical protein GOVbin655_11 [Prokaryotic dsDNA virus sp.]|tara:strand:+ start:2753 stop:3448 length:696 start_codon:yes stop_codon:yes gene_type:complete